MRRNDPHCLGIELHDREIRLVLANVRGGKASVVKAAVFPLSHGAVSNGVILEPATVSIALKRAVDSLGSSITAAAVGVAGEQSHFRTVTVPPCPESELPALVASEIEHQGALNLVDPYGFFPIHPTGAEGDAMQTLAVVGADAVLTQSLVECLEGAGLGVSALEPSPLAMLRTGLAGVPSGTSTFALVIGRQTTEAAYFVGGNLAAFRRLDVGTDALILAYAPYYDNEEGLGEPWTGVDADAADRLSLEAQRTMDYVQRADRSAAIDRVRIVCDDPGVEPLTRILESRFGLPIELVRPPAAEGEAADPRFSAAYGLAIRSINGLTSPSIDLYTAGRIEAHRVETKRYFAGSILVACLSAAVGMVGCLMYNGQIAASQRRVAGLKTQIEATKKATSDAQDAQAAEAARDRALRKEGVPMGALIDDVSASLDANVGLKLVSVGDDMKVHLEGEARDETSLVRTAESLKTSRVLRNVAVDRFDRDVKGTDPKMAGGIKFEISGATVAADRLARKPKAS